jgi:hypothetical protein
LRLAFLLTPGDKSALRRIFQANSVLWGGIYNFIIPILGTLPKRYKDPRFRNPSAKDFMKGLADAFQPDMFVESKDGQAELLGVDSNRVISLANLLAHDDEGRCTYGIDVRTICAALYEKTFRFVQRHPPAVILPKSETRAWELFNACVFGEYPEEGPLRDVTKHVKGALDARTQVINPAQFTKLFSDKTLYPLRIGAFELDTRNSNWFIGPHLFYMDPAEPFDLIEYWNLRAIGWPIKPLPRNLASQLQAYCNAFIADAHKPFKHQPDAFHHGTFVCSRSCSLKEMEAFTSTLTRPPEALISIDNRVPRVWEEWGRNADHSKPQTIECETREIETSAIGSSMHLRTALPRFAEDSRYSAGEHACINVLEKSPGGAPVIPWQTADMSALTGGTREEWTWVNREGIVTTAGAYRSFKHLYLSPSPLNVFVAFAKAHALDLELSPVGRICQEIVNSVGSLKWVRTVVEEELMPLLDRMAFGELGEEAREEEDGVPRRIRKSSVSFKTLWGTLLKSTNNDQRIASNKLRNLMAANALQLGLQVLCTHCQETNWHPIGGLTDELKCNRCLREQDFPSAPPPDSNAWAYKVRGPFAAPNFARGAYCVAATAAFIEERVAQEITWVPSFVLRKGKEQVAEADIGVFFRPGHFSHVQGPLLLLGECKSFNYFDEKDYARARSLGKLFPGAILCFSTFRKDLTVPEKKSIASLARAGRKSLKTGQQKNPVLILTGKELFGQFSTLGRELFEDDPHARNIYLRKDIEDICDFTLQKHLGIESYYEWITRRKKQDETKTPPSKVPTGNP